MLKNNAAPGYSLKLSKFHRISIAGVATLGAAALAFTLAPDNNAHAATHDSAAIVSKIAYSDNKTKDVTASTPGQMPVRS